MLMLCIALVFALYEHHMILDGLTEECAVHNRVVRFGVLFGQMPVVLLWILTIGLQRNWGSGLAWSIFAVGTVVVNSVMTWLIHKRTRMVKDDRDAVLEELRNVNITSPSFPDIVRRTFVVMDADDNGSLDMDEFRHLLQLILAGNEVELNSEKFSETMLLARKFQNHEGLLSELAFNDALIYILSRLGLIRDGNFNLAIAKPQGLRAGVASMTHRTPVARWVDS